MSIQNLPSDVFLSILYDYCDVIDVVRTDSAMCCKYLRLKELNRDYQRPYNLNPKNLPPFYAAIRWILAHNFRLVSIHSQFLLKLTPDELDEFFVLFDGSLAKNVWVDRPVPPELLRRMLQACPKITGLQHAVIDENWESVLPEENCIEDMIVNGNTCAELKIFETCLTSGRLKLTSLDLSFYWSADPIEAREASLGGILAACGGTLISLNLWASSKSTDFLVTQITSRCPHLEKIYLGSARLQDRHVYSLSTQCQKLKQLSNVEWGEMEEGEGEVADENTQSEEEKRSSSCRGLRAMLSHAHLFDGLMITVGAKATLGGKNL